MATTPDVLVDRYEVGRLLGAGGMAEVFEAPARLLPRRVAIKTLQSRSGPDPDSLLRFRREAQLAASLTHPNVVQVFDAGVQEGTHFIVMEFVEGRTVKDVIRAEGPLYPDRAAELCADVCSALAAAHARGLIHRDVKPGNVMLTPSGTVKVMDFGIARATTSETITQTAAVVGTAQYISPEQAQGQTVDFRSDLYSLGCCLYEMLTGTVPFTGATPVAIAYRHVREDPTPPRMLNPDVPPALEAICLKAMAKLPEDRYQTAAEMREDLERVRAGWAPAAATLAAQRPPTDAAATTVLGATVAPSRAARHGEPPPRRGRRWLLWVLVPIGVLALTGLVAFLISKVVNPLPPVAGPTTFPVVTTSPPTRPPPPARPCRPARSSTSPSAAGAAECLASSCSAAARSARSTPPAWRRNRLPDREGAEQALVDAAVAGIAGVHPQADAAAGGQPAGGQQRPVPAGAEPVQRDRRPVRAAVGGEPQVRGDHLAGRGALETVDVQVDGGGVAGGQPVAAAERAPPVVGLQQRQHRAPPARRRARGEPPARVGDVGEPQQPVDVEVALQPVAGRRGPDGRLQERVGAAGQQLAVAVQADGALGDRLVAELEEAALVAAGVAEVGDAQEHRGGVAVAERLRMQRRLEPALRQALARRVGARAEAEQAEVGVVG